MSENAKIKTWRGNLRLRYVVPVIVVLGIILFILALAASCRGQNGRYGLKPYRLTDTPQSNLVGGEVVFLTFVELNSEPDVYQNQRIRVTGDKITIVPERCRVFTGPEFTWGLIAEGLQLHTFGFDKLVSRLPDGLTMTVEGIWRQYTGPLGCGKEPEDGAAWYLQVERIISPNPLPLGKGTPFATIQVPLAGDSGIAITPFVTQTPETAVTEQPSIGITPLPTDSTLPVNTPSSPAAATAATQPTATSDPASSTATRSSGVTPPATPPPGSTPTPNAPGTLTPTVPSGNTQTPAPTLTGYPGADPSTAVPTNTPYPGSS
ncbi:MAG: hypothetical protein CSB13_05100 [Chloroflexi bacterium]|nr:MAG: hypothetical protein CSB13_05100 [Chloroflexota bacterium]